VAGRLAPDSGSATVELAAAIPLLVAVALAMVSLLGLARDQVLAQGAAREAAREAAVGGDLTRALAAARAALPLGRAARVAVAPEGATRVRASVELPVGLPFGVPPVAVKATAVAAREPGPHRSRPTSECAHRPPDATPARAGSAPASSRERLTAAEDGGATLVALALAGVILMVGVVAVDLGALVSARAAVQTAADMAALAAITPVDPFALDRQGEAERPEGRATSRAAEIGPPTGPSWCCASARRFRRWSVSGGGCDWFQAASP